MRLRCTLICFAFFYLLAGGQSALAATPVGLCAFPRDLQLEIASNYPGARPVSLPELEEDDRKLFHREHDDQCPGAVRVNFYGDGKPTWALVLVTVEGTDRRAELVVARQLGRDWEFLSLEKLEKAELVPIPVVWREGPGQYDSVSEAKTIRAAYSVIVLCGYGSWSIVYAWTGKKVEKAWTSD